MAVTIYRPLAVDISEVQLLVACSEKSNNPNAKIVMTMTNYHYHSFVVTYYCTILS